LAEEHAVGGEGDVGLGEAFLGVASESLEFGFAGFRGGEEAETKAGGELLELAFPVGEKRCGQD